jgi:hypothetical protein
MEGRATSRDQQTKEDLTNSSQSPHAMACFGGNIDVS